MTEHRPGDLLRLICDFTNPTPDGEPSLWDQLLAPSKRSGAAGGSKPGSRLPLDAGILSIVTEVDDWTRSAMLSGACWVASNVPARLRWIETHGDPDLSWQWCKTLDRWISEAKAQLGLTVTRTPLPRGTRCPECDEAWVFPLNPDGEETRQPAVVVAWTPAGHVERVMCLACHWEGDSSRLHDVAEWQAERARQVAALRA